jgi:hypothetical protein
MTLQLPETKPELPELDSLWDFFFFSICCFSQDLNWSYELCLKEARHWWPLARCKTKGVEQGMQWAVLGWLAGMRGTSPFTS